MDPMANSKTSALFTMSVKVNCFTRYHLSATYVNIPWDWISRNANSHKLTRVDSRPETPTLGLRFKRAELTLRFTCVPVRENLMKLREKKKEV